jgi:hypothetical protein
MHRALDGRMIGQAPFVLLTLNARFGKRQLAVPQTGTCGHIQQGDGTSRDHSGGLHSL